jgi:hypothetical protein
MTEAGAKVIMGRILVYIGLVSEIITIIEI